MKKLHTAPISGMQELLPNEQLLFDRFKHTIAEQYRRHGFLRIETPLIDRQEILLAKAGGDTEKQIYKVIKTHEQAEDSSEALRFDHTVPLARYVVEHENDLQFPFAVTQIARNFRGERAQRNRFREFYQCDADVIGRDNLPIMYDSAVISCIRDTLRALNLPPFLVRIGNRKILSGFLGLLGLSDQTQTISGIIDNAEKVPPEATRAALEKLRLSATQIQQICAFIAINGTFEHVKAQLEHILGLKLNAETTEAVSTAKTETAKTSTTNAEAADTANPLDTLNRGLSELKTVFDALQTQPNADDYTIDFMIVRGLDYYTGTVFEVFIKNHREIGSISGGGRYENLAGFFSPHKFPGVGGSIGLTRLFNTLKDANLLPENTSALPLDYVLLPLDQTTYPATLTLAAKLRAKGKTVDIDFDTRKLGAKLNRAGKIAAFAVVIGENEIRADRFTAKNLKTGAEIVLDC